MSEPRTFTWDRVAIVGLVALFCLTVYRAATQSITHDEAITWNSYASQAWAGYFEPYWVNNHVLNSILSRMSVKVFGLSEFAVRLPSVLAGAVYLIAARWIGLMLFGPGARAAVVSLLLALDPLVLDHLSASRGYGAAVAWFLLALCSLMRALNEDDPGSRSLFLAGVFSGLAMLSNLTAAYPVMAAILAFLWARRPRWRTLWTQFAVPAILIPGIVMIIPLSTVRAGDFEEGYDSLAASVKSLAYLSFLRVPLVPGRVTAWLMDALIGLTLPAVSVLVVLAALCALRQWRARDGDRHLAFFCVLPPVLATLLYTSHVLGGLPYPYTRRALYMVPVVLLSAAVLCFRYRSLRAVRYGSAFAGIVLLTAFVLQLETTYYGEWQYDSGSRRIAAWIAAHDDPRKRTVIRANWLFEPSLNFYRDLMHRNWNWVDRDPVDSGPADFWVLAPRLDQNYIDKLHLKTVFRDDATGNIIAEAGETTETGASK